MLRNEDFDDDEFGPSMPASRERSLPGSMLDAVARLRSRYDESDCGTTRVLELEDEAGGFFAVRTTTDGDDGYLLLFDAGGQCEGGARTLLELCEWDTLDRTLALLRVPNVAASIPQALKARRGTSLWMEFLR
jgi:hypothetical protein